MALGKWDIESQEHHPQHQARKTQSQSLESPEGTWERFPSADGPQHWSVEADTVWVPVSEKKWVI